VYPKLAGMRLVFTGGHTLSHRTRGEQNDQWCGERGSSEKPFQPSQIQSPPRGR